MGKAVSLLNPKEDEIKKCVEIVEEEWGFGDKLLYIGCIEAMKNVKLRDIQEKDIKGPIRVFLINWGMMGIVLNRKDRKNWERKLLQVLREEKFCDKLERFRNLNLENANIDELKKEITDCYQEVRDIVGPTSASKVLHLICPNFFPLWDANIRKLVSQECKELGKGSIDDRAEGYYRFMKEVKDFLERYEKILSELSRKYGKPKLRVVDEFMWYVSRYR
ncbi:DUF6308 family protein [Archaeoglobus profundus]|uniref:Uncharacterized protein n=1 Tax=Archaeoglobus profundus (strain DSM 5631 / JCM 9629 / NBRC 100127 / Av18) TaxID=572546 RepID=D2RFB8_ARCPA|nr:DUF6308 family protein [Archaeoglobus profundus]ADB58812.1 hypothetical protein Arcpr_1768 [Archaeoglobus profundus DSM 5631]